MDTPRKRLHDLLCSLFAADDLRRWIRHDAEISVLSDLLPENTAPFASVVDHAVSQLERRGLVNDRFFSALTKEFPARRGDILASARDFGCVTHEANIWANSDAPVFPQQKLAREASAARERGDIETAKILQRASRTGKPLTRNEILENRYLLLSRIESGGFADVWEGLDLDNNSRRVAVKALRPESSMDASKLTRFRQGVAKQKELRHDNIVPILASGSTTDGVDFVIMEYINGGSLKSIARNGIPLESATRILQDMCSALAHIHKQGITHRDVKPGNILADTNGRWYITDFDLMLAPDETGGTKTGAGLGTFLYAAPEALDNACTADARSDIFGLGMSLVYALSNECNLPASTYRDPDTVLARLEVSPRIQDVLRKSIDWDPAKRYSNVSEFLEAWKEASTTNHDSSHTTPPHPNKTATTPAARAPSSVIGSSSFEIGHDKYGSWLLFTAGGIEHRLRWIPPGSFLMGSPEAEVGRFDDEGPRHRVSVTSGFWLGESQCTQALWVAITNENPSHFTGDLSRPVERVTWNDCVRFIARLNARVKGLRSRLPTEAEWEYACRAGTDDARYGNIDMIAWYSKNSGGETHAVRQKQPNDWGLYDMLGNVREWCSDLKGDYDQAESENSIGAESGVWRVYRGGSFRHGERRARAACRVGGPPTNSRHTIGFRLACDPEFASSSGTSKATIPAGASEYQSTRRYRIGDIVGHKKFGVGTVVDAQQTWVEVSFREGGTRRLVHGRGSG